MKTLAKISIAMMTAVSILGTSCKEDKSPAATGPETTKDQPVTEVQSAGTPSLDIHTAAYLGALKEIRLHIETGTDLDRKDQYGSTPLIIAITFGKTDVARALIEGGAELSAVNNDGSTPLHIAAFFCKPEIVTMLLENGADKTLKNNYGATPQETVTPPFDQVKPIYDTIGNSLEPLGMKLDYEYLEATRPQIAEMLKEG